MMTTVLHRIGRTTMDAARTTCRRRNAAGVVQTHFRCQHPHQQRRSAATEAEAELRRFRTTTTTMGVAFVGTAAALSLAESDAVAHARASAASAFLPGSDSARRRRWLLFDQLGVGSFGTVHIGLHEDTGEVAAIKIVEPDHRNYATLEREIAALKRVRALGGHANIIDLRDVYVDGRKVFLVTELARGGELYEQIVSHGALDESRARAVARDVAQALAFLHRHGLVHKDVKPENILLAARSTDRNGGPTPVSPTAPFVKLADFGSAGPPMTATSSSLDDIGTSAYLPPEFLRHGICAPASDLWALGCVLYITLCGAHPFDLDGTASDEEVEFRIKNMPVVFDFAPWTNVSTDAKVLIAQLLDKDPARRPTAEQLLSHPWIAAELQQQIASPIASAAVASGIPQQEPPTGMLSAATVMIAEALAARAAPIHAHA